ncbi:MAG: glycosyltransferase [Deltaproteobacteria bacterium]|nr:glycosyltransferase [Deltaproteobacteria bacterium]
MTVWEENLGALEKSNPALARKIFQAQVPTDYRLAPSRRGRPYLQVGRRRLHSPYDPVKEGEDWYKAQVLGEDEPLVIFGLGLGYHVLPLLKEGQQAWVVEPSLAVARLALETNDLTILLVENRLRVGQDFSGLPRPARLLEHGPSRRLAPELYRRLADFLAGVKETLGPLKILVVSPLYGGSLPIARYAARGFKNSGHDAELLDFSPFYGGHQALAGMTKDQGRLNRFTRDWLKFLGEILLSKVREMRPDLVLCLAQAPVTPELLGALKSEGVLAAYWFVEDFQVFPYWRDLAPQVDVFFTLQEEPFLEELRKAGVKNAAFLPLAADPEVYRPLSLSPEEKRRYGAALAFVGAGYRNRQEFFQGFLDLDFKIWGSDWNLKGPLAAAIQNGGERVSADQAVKIFNASLINLNLHSSPFYAGINPEGDYLNPRVFDIAAAGGFQLVDRRAQLPRFFEPEEELGVFSSLSEARDKIGYFLTHGDERRRVAAQGRERCLREHTYTQRMEEALTVIAGFFPDALPRRPPREDALSRLRRQFPPDHPVQAVLARAPEGTTELSDLVEHLKAGEAPLTEPEALLWLLHEFGQGLERGRF